MKSLFLTGAVMLSIPAALAVSASAQTMPPPASEPGMSSTQLPPDDMPPPPDEGMTTPTDPTVGTPPSPDMGDPNAGQPTGAVPDEPGMSPAPAGVPRDPAAPVGSSSNPVTTGGNMTPAPDATKDYPTCSKTVQDGCVNRNEAKKSRKPR